MTKPRQILMNKMRANRERIAERRVHDEWTWFVKNERAMRINGVLFQRGMPLADPALPLMFGNHVIQLPKDGKPFKPPYPWLPDAINAEFARVGGAERYSVPDWAERFSQC